MSTADNIRKGQQSLLMYADELAKLHHVKLDYSEKSLKNVDTILARVHNEYAKSAKTEADIDGFYGIALSVAAYLIEVIERAHGEGTWQKDDPKFGENSWPYTHGDKIIFPVDWATKYITDGKTESIAPKYVAYFKSNEVAGSKWGWPGGFKKK